MAIDTRRRRLIGAVGALGVASIVPFAAAKAKPRVIKVIAKKFEFLPAVIHVKRGETVTLHLTAPEVPMGINLADFNVRADIVPGKTASLDLTADKSGTFTFLCDVFCGSGHESMEGTIVVT